MKGNQIIKVFVVIALLLVGFFTLRAILNTGEMVSPDISSTEEVPSQAVTEEAPSQTVTEEAPLVSQPMGTSVLDLVRVINLTVEPHDFAIDAQGNIYVVDLANPQIHKYDKTGNLLTSWGSQGSGDGQFSFAPPPDGPPIDGGFVTLDELGNVYISDSFNNRVQKFDAEGNFLKSFATIGASDAILNIPGPISSDLNGNIYVADFDGVHQFNLEGDYIKSLQTAGEVAIDSQGNLYSPIAFQNMVAKMDSAGQTITTWGSQGTTGDATFEFPMTVLIDSQDRIYVGDQSGRLQIFDTEGNFLGRFNLTTTDQLQVMMPIIASMDSEELIYVGAKDRAVIYVLRTLQASENTQTYPEGSIAAYLESDGRFTTILRIFDKAKGAETVPWPWLQNPERTLTLFAPTDEAFSALPTETIERLAADPVLAEKLLTHHLLDRKLLSKDFGLLPTWPTVLTTQTITIEIKEDGFWYAGVKIIETDIEVGRAVIHVINSVTGLQLIDN
jgi:uncharacterized surface protein with fasciclin (FAS1) repeats